MIQSAPESYYVHKENAEEAKKLIDKGKKLSQSEREYWRDRISELEFQRTPLQRILNNGAAVGIAAIATLVATYGFVADDSNIIKILGMIAIIIFGLIILKVMSPKVHAARKEDKELREKIQNCYDILLGRKS